MLISEVIKAPILTEKSYSLMDQGIYTFKVDKRSNQYEVARAVEFIFKVQTEKVNIINIARKPKKVGRFSGFVPAYKKAYVYLKEGYVINFFPNEAAEEEKVSKKAKTVKLEEVISKDKASAAEAKAAAKIAAKTKNVVTAKRVVRKDREGK